MGVGGATWDTAGTLTLGSNTFDLADATEDEPEDEGGILELGWWKFTPSTPGLLDLDDHGATSRMYHGTDAERVQDFPLSGHGNAWLLVEGVEYRIKVGHIFGDPPPSGSYELTAAFAVWSVSEWKSDLHDRDDNFVYLPEGNAGGALDEAWMLDCVRLGSRRLGDVLFTETISGPWGIDARECAITHALWGNQFSSLWDGTCPVPLPGIADLELSGGSAVEFNYTDHTSIPDLIADTAHMIVRTTAFGVWLVPVKEHLPERGMLSDPNPVDYGYTSEAQVQYEDRYVTLWKVEIADAAGTEGVDPDSRYAVNYSQQPQFSAGEWEAWPLGGLPGTPLDGPEWVDGPDPYFTTFSSEGVDLEDKTFYPLDTPPDGFESLTQDYLNDSYDYGVIAGPAEAFFDRDLTADRVAPVAVVVKAYVRSPRFRFIYPGGTIPPRRIFGRSDGATHGAARIFGGGNTVQSGNRTFGGIL